MIDFGNSGINVTSPYNSITPDSSSKGLTDNKIESENSDKNTNSNKEKNNPQKVSGGQNPDELNLKEIQELSKLKQRDREVRSHEQAHINAGGQYVRSGARFDYQKGPDGKNYAVGGEVSIDTSKIPGDPEATAKKMQRIRSAAMAPASPSSQDRIVASKASRIENRMRTEILLKRYEESASFEKGRADAKPGLMKEATGAVHKPGAGLSVFA